VVTAEVNIASTSTISGASALSGAMVMLTMLKSWIIIDGKGKMTEKLPPIHPGEILLTEFLQPMGVSQYRLARAIGVPARRINEIVLGKRSISPDTALRLARYFGLSERFWLNLQTRYDLELAKDRLAGRLENEVSVHEPVSVG
jgi:antitoxin HigA-1